MAPLAYYKGMKKQPRIRLSIKLLWKLFGKEYQKYLTEVVEENDCAYNFLSFLEEYVKPPTL